MVRTACRELSKPLAGFEPVTICLQHRSKMPRELRGGISDKIAVSTSNHGTDQTADAGKMLNECRNLLDGLYYQVSSVRK